MWQSILKVVYNFLEQEPLWTYLSLSVYTAWYLQVCSNQEPHCEQASSRQKKQFFSLGAISLREPGRSSEVGSHRQKIKTGEGTTQLQQAAENFVRSAHIRGTNV